MPGYLGQPAQLDVEALEELHLLHVEPDEAVRGLLHEDQVDQVGHSELVKVREVDDGGIAGKGSVERTPKTKKLAVSPHLVDRMVIR